MLRSRQSSQSNFLHSLRCWNKSSESCTMLPSRNRVVQNRMPLAQLVSGQDSRTKRRKNAVGTFCNIGATTPAVSYALRAQCTVMGASRSTRNPSSASFATPACAAVSYWMSAEPLFFGAPTETGTRRMSERPGYLQWAEGEQVCGAYQDADHVLLEQRRQHLGVDLGREALDEKCRVGLASLLRGSWSSCWCLLVVRLLHHRLCAP